MTNEFENFNDRDEEWLRELELRATDLENDLFDWREAHAKELADSSLAWTGHRSDPGKAGPGCCEPSLGRHRPRGRRPGRPGRSTTSWTTHRRMPSRRTSPTTS